MDQDKRIDWILRIGIFGTFLGHGMFALQAKQGWIKYLVAAGFSEPTAITLLPVIGIIDIAVALCVIIKPIRAVLLWAILWAFATALIRPVSGEPIWDFVERSANFMLPLAFLAWRGLPASAKEWMS